MFCVDADGKEYEKLVEEMLGSLVISASDEGEVIKHHEDLHVELKECKSKGLTNDHGSLLKD